jgi:integrase
MPSVPRRPKGALSRRADGRWVGSVLLPDGTRKVLYGKTQAEVRRKQGEWQKRIADGISSDAGRQTVATYLSWWLDNQAKPHLRATTFRGYRSYVTLHLIPGLGGYRLATLNPQQVQTYLHAAQDGGLSATSVVQIRAILRRALSNAQRMGLVGKNAAALTDRARQEVREIVPLTPQQAVTLMTGMTEDRHGPLYLTALTTGLRQGELLGLRWTDVALESRILTVAQQLQRIGGEFRFVPPKTEKSRRAIVLPELAVQALRTEQARQTERHQELGDAWGASNLVFTGDDGQPLHATTISHAFSALTISLKLPRQRFHDLRHLAASLLLAQGHSLKEVSETLGHAGVAITGNLYGHVYPEARQNIADGMDAILRRHGAD